MKVTSLTIAASLALIASSQAAVSFTGTAASGLGSVVVPQNTLILLIVDTTSSGNTASNGFLNGSSFSGDLTAANDPHIVANSSTSVGSTFGGDTILGALGVTTAGALNGGFTFDNIAAYQGKAFALVYFPTLTTASTTIPNGVAYGIVSGVDWTLPASNNGESFSFATNSADNTTYFRVTVSGGVASNDNFTTSAGAVFTTGAIPEPSVALLGAVGALGLLRRRRN